VPRSIAQPDYANTGVPKGEMRLNKNKIELLNTKTPEAMRKVCRLSRELLDAVAQRSSQA
jgi:methionyl aminopeptidase